MIWVSKTSTVERVLYTIPNLRKLVKWKELSPSASFRINADMRRCDRGNICYPSSHKSVSRQGGSCYRECKQRSPVFRSALFDFCKRSPQMFPESNTSLVQNAMNRISTRWFVTLFVQIGIMHQDQCGRTVVITYTPLQILFYSHDVVDTALEWRDRTGILVNAN